jgi:hypothetical protein
VFGNYSKFFGSIIGGIAGILVAKGVVPADAVTPDNINVVLAGIGTCVTVGGAIFTYLFPANKPS